MAMAMQQPDSAAPAPATPAVPGRRRGRALLRRTATAGLLLVLVGAVAWALRDQDWSALGEVLRQQSTTYFLLMAAGAVLLNAVGTVLTMVGWRAVLSGVGEPMAAIPAARIFFVGQFAKYVPGKVLGAVVTVQMGRSAGAPAIRMVSAWLLALVVAMLTATTLGLAAAFQLVEGSLIWLALAGVPVVAVLVRPSLVERAMAVAARLLRRPAPATRISGAAIRRAVLLQSGAWVAGGLHLWWLAVAFGAPPAGALVLCVGAFSLAAVAGMVAVFAPDGIGVREVVLLAALSAVLPVPVATVVALVSRVVVTIGEVVTAGVGLLWTETLRRRQRRRAADPPTADPATDWDGAAAAAAARSSA